MAQSLARILVHGVFSTKNRAPLITDEIESKLDAYLAGTLNLMKCPAIEIGGMPNHVHVLFVLSKELAIKNVMQDVKQESSKWMKLQAPSFRRFYWQNGYAAFSIGESGIEQVRRYIRRQKEHHRKMSFEDELRALLKKYHVEYEERYVWD